MKEAANADKMKEDGRFWAERTRGETMEEEARQARVGVEDVFDVWMDAGAEPHPERLTT